MSLPSDSEGPLILASPSDSQINLSRSCRKSRPLLDKFPFEPIYAYPSVAQMGSTLEELSVQ